MSFVQPSLGMFGFRGARAVRNVATGGTVRSDERRLRPLNTRQIKSVRRIVNSSKETHIYATTISGGEVTSTVTFNDLSTIAQGDDHDQRLGDQVKCTRLRLKGNFTRDDGASVDTFDQIRVVVFIWHPDDANEPPAATTDILESATLYYHQPLQLEASKRKKFTVLYDSHFDLPTREGGDLKRSLKNISINKKLRNTIYFNDAATTGRNKIYMMRLGFYAAGGDNSACNIVSTLAYKQK